MSLPNAPGTLMAGTLMNSKVSDAVTAPLAYLELLLS